jgi:hypothetical protein
MRKMFKWQGLLATLMLASLLTVFAPAQDAAAQTSNASVVLEVSSVRFKDKLQISGEGFGSRQRIAFWVTGPNGKAYDYGGAFTDYKGRLFFVGDTIVNVTNVGEAIPGGKWFITAKNIETGQTFIGDFDVRLPQIVYSAATVVEGVVVIAGITGTGFDPNERVSFWVTDSQGKVLGLGAARSTGVGDLDGTYVTSFTGTAGTYKLTAQGNFSETPVVIDVVVR